MTLRPLGDRVLVLMDPEPEQVRGIIISAGKPPPQNQGTIIEAGPDAEGIKKGDRILWTRWHAQDVEVDGVMHKVMKAEEVMAVLS